MSALLTEFRLRALRSGVPLSVHLDLTYRCNERCVHCYLDHEDRGEMTTAEIVSLLEQFAAAGVFFLILSGGEIFLRKDLFEILEVARRLRFSVKLKTNAVMVRPARAERIARLGVESVQVSVYSDRADVHDRITQLPGSLRRTLEGVRALRDAGVAVSLANVLMKQNAGDYPGVQALAARMGVGYHVDPTITPMLDGGRSVVALNMDPGELQGIFADASLTGAPDACAPPNATVPGEDELAALPCSAGHTACYVSPYGEVFPCVAFPLPCGNVREKPFEEIWRNSPQLHEVRSIRNAEVEGCSTCSQGDSCSRCPGLAYLEGNMRGPSTQDCEKTLARTGVRSRHLASQGEGVPGSAGRAVTGEACGRPAPAARPVIWLRPG